MCHLIWIRREAWYSTCNFNVINYLFLGMQTVCLMFLNLLRRKLLQEQYSLDL